MGWGSATCQGFECPAVQWLVRQGRNLDGSAGGSFDPDWCACVKGNVPGDSIRINRRMGSIGGCSGDEHRMIRSDGNSGGGGELAFLNKHPVANRGGNGHRAQTSAGRAECGTRGSAGDHGLRRDFTVGCRPVNRSAVGGLGGDGEGGGLVGTEIEIEVAI